MSGKICRNFKCAYNRTENVSACAHAPSCLDYEDALCDVLAPLRAQNKKALLSGLDCLASGKTKGDCRVCRYENSGECCRTIAAEAAELIRELTGG